MFKFLLTLVLLTTICLADPCTIPNYYEFIDNFTLMTNDLDNLVHNQFSNRAIDGFTTSEKVIVSNAKYTSSYK